MAALSLPGTLLLFTLFLPTPLLLFKPFLPSLTNHPLPPRQCIYILQGHTSTIRCIRVLHNRPIAISGSRDATLRVWDVQKGKCLRVLEGHHQSVRCLDVCGSRVVSGSYDNTCRVGALLLLFFVFRLDRAWSFSTPLLSLFKSGWAFETTWCFFFRARLAVHFLWASGVPSWCPSFSPAGALSSSLAGTLSSSPAGAHFIEPSRCSFSDTGGLSSSLVLPLSWVEITLFP